MFRFTRKPSSGSQNQYLAKITHLVQSAYVELVQDVSVIAVYCDLQGVCNVHCVHQLEIQVLDTSEVLRTCNSVGNC